MIISKVINNEKEYYQIIDTAGVHIIDEATEELALAKYTAIKEREANPPEPSVEENRKAEYLTKGLTPEKLIIALWEKVIEGRSEEADKLQAERVKVKQKYPKG